MLRHRTALNRDQIITHLILTEDADEAAAALAGPDLLAALESALDAEDGNKSWEETALAAVTKARLLRIFPTTQQTDEATS